MELEILTPRNLAQLAAALRRATPNTSLLAGGTDLVIHLRAPGPAPDLLIDLSAMRELAFVRLEGDQVHVGAMTTFAQMQTDATLLSFARCLAETAAQVGSVQIRNAATIGGNVANASPCGDTIPMLLALDAQVQVLDADGRITRRALREIVAGAGTNSLAPGQAIIGFWFGALAARQRGAFAKVGVRSAMTVAKLSLAVVLDFDQASRRCSAAKVAFGALGAVAFRDAGVESVLRGQVANGAAAQAFAQACVDAVRRAIPNRPSLAYKQHAMVGLAYDIWNALQICAPCEPAGWLDRSP